MENETRNEITPIGILKELRIQVDTIVKTINALREDENFKSAIRELSLACTKAQESKHWLGESLGSMGQSLPVDYRDEAVLAPIDKEVLEGTIEEDKEGE